MARPSFKKKIPLLNLKTVKRIMIKKSIAEGKLHVCRGQTLSLFYIWTTIFFVSLLLLFYSFWNQSEDLVNLDISFTLNLATKNKKPSKSTNLLMSVIKLGSQKINIKLFFVKYQLGNKLEMKKA